MESSASRLVQREVVSPVRTLRFASISGVIGVRPQLSLQGHLLRTRSSPLARQMLNVMFHHLPLEERASAEPAGRHAVEAATSSAHVTVKLNVMHQALVRF